MLFGHNFAPVPHDKPLSNASTNDTILMYDSKVIWLFSVNKLTATHRLFIGGSSHKFHRYSAYCLSKRAEYIFIHSVTDDFRRDLLFFSKLAVFAIVGHGFFPQSESSCVSAVSKLAYPDNRAVLNRARAYALCPRQCACPECRGCYVKLVAISPRSRQKARHYADDIFKFASF